MKVQRFVSKLGPVVAILLVWLVVGWQSTAAQDTNGITSPASGAVVSGIVEVRGVATDPRFRRVEIALLRSGDENAATFIGRVQSEANGTILGFDSTRYPDGAHTLRMRVVRTDGNYTEYFTPIVIRNGGVAQQDPNGITNIRPLIDGAASGEMRVMGVAYHPALLEWQLWLLPFGKESGATLLNEGRRPFVLPGALAGFVDTTRFPDGEHILRLRIVQSNRSYQDYDQPLVINNARPRTTTGNGFVSITDGQILSGTVRITGVADHPEFVKWQLDLLREHDPQRASFLNWSAFAAAETTQFVRLDTTLFPNGEHTLRLRVVRRDYNYDEHLVKIVIAN
jgi:hypothetical protein